jgi:hypothetical protein
MLLLPGRGGLLFFLRLSFSSAGASEEDFSLKPVLILLFKLAEAEVLDGGAKRLL